MPLFFFNKYKKYLYIMLINFFNQILGLKIKYKNAFVNYWIRFYTYYLKNVFIKIETLITDLFFSFKKEYDNLYYLINLRKNKNISFLKYFRLLANFSYKKKTYNIIYFFFIRKKYILYRLKKYFNLLKYFENIKFLIFLKYFLYIFILQFFLFWFNSYFLTLKNNFINYIYYNNWISNYCLIFKDAYNNLFFFKKIKKWNNILILKYIYFFYVNIII